MSRVPHASGGSDRPRAEELEGLEELGDDAIVGYQHGAHLPKPRAQVTEEKRSVVISDHPAPGSNPPDDPEIAADARATQRLGPGAKKRSERTEKTVVIRDRRQIDELRREMAKRKPQALAEAEAEAQARAAAPPRSGVLLWVIVGVAAFLVGTLVALFTVKDDGAKGSSVEPVVSAAPQASTAPTTSSEPPAVSIDELPIEGSKKK